ncbi:MAG: 50S ribosomal protein L11 methyltransferase [Aggregatilineales bacterium]
MRWIEVTLETDREAAEAVTEVLHRYGHQGVAIEQAGFYIETWEDEVPQPDRLLVRAYLPEDEHADAAKAQLEEALYQLHRLYAAVPTTPSYRLVDEQDWAEAWKANYHPLRVGRRLVVCPPWIEVASAPDDIVIVLDPGMAFGTGTHPSTQLVLEAAEDLLPERQGAHVLDLGCGSGILAIGAAKLGAGSIRALDTDPMAVRITLENATLNGVQDLISAQVGSLEQLIANDETFDLALVNILAKVIVTMCDQGLGRVIKPNGIAVFGGIIEEQAAEVEVALARAGLVPYQRRTSGDWVVIEVRRTL